MTDDDMLDAERALLDADEALGQDIAARTDVEAMLARVKHRARQASAVPSPPGTDENTPVFTISVAAHLAGLHPQTLRSYNRIGLVSPRPTANGGRRYSVREIALLREINRLSQEEGVNLAGIKRIIELENQLNTLRDQTQELMSELVDVERKAAAIHLTAREKDVLNLVTSGMTTAQTAHTLGISTKTADATLHQARGKYRAVGLDADTTLDLVNELRTAGHFA
jgi:MerR family transcriptional regulator/heat shock protein HspR